MPGTTTLEKIRRVAEKRQALWSKTSSLTAADRATIGRLTTELEGLWEQHRAQLAKRLVTVNRRPARPGVAPHRRRTAA